MKLYRGNKKMKLLKTDLVTGKKEVMRITSELINNLAYYSEIKKRKVKVLLLTGHEIKTRNNATFKLIGK